jgi:hypothetical protein
VRAHALVELARDGRPAVLLPILAREEVCMQETRTVLAIYV